MKKVIVALCAIVLSVGAYAQSAQPAPANTTQQAPPKGKGGGRGRALQQAGVTPEEQAKLKAAREAAKAEREAIKNDASLGANDRQAKLKALETSKKEKVDAILGKEKAEKLRAEREARRNDRKNDRKEKGEAKSDHPEKDHQGEGKNDKNDATKGEGKKGNGKKTKID